MLKNYLGPKPSSSQNFSINHWNLNSISGKNYSKLSLLRASVSAPEFDVIWVFETYLDSDTSFVDGNLEIVGYTLIRNNHLSKLSQMVFYYKNSFAFRLLDIYYLEESINF